MDRKLLMKEFMRLRGREVVADRRAPVPGVRFYYREYADCLRDRQVFEITEVRSGVIVYSSVCFSGRDCSDHLPPNYCLTLEKFLKEAVLVDKSGGELVTIDKWLGQTSVKNSEDHLDILFGGLNSEQQLVGSAVS